MPLPIRFIKLSEPIKSGHTKLASIPGETATLPGFIHSLKGLLLDGEFAKQERKIRK